MLATELRNFSRVWRQFSAYRSRNVTFFMGLQFNSVWLKHNIYLKTNNVSYEALTRKSYMSRDSMLFLDTLFMHQRDYINILLLSIMQYVVSAPTIIIFKSKKRHIFLPIVSFEYTINLIVLKLNNRIYSKKYITSHIWCWNSYTWMSVAAG